MLQFAVGHDKEDRQEVGHEEGGHSDHDPPEFPGPTCLCSWTYSIWVQYLKGSIFFGICLGNFFQNFFTLLMDIFGRLNLKSLWIQI